MSETCSTMVLDSLCRALLPLAVAPEIVVATQAPFACVVFPLSPVGPRQRPTSRQGEAFRDERS